MPIESIPLITAGDSFLIELEILPTCVRIVSISRFIDNMNSEATSETFRSLDPETKRAVISQVNRRHPTKMVRT